MDMRITTFFRWFWRVDCRTERLLSRLNTNSERYAIIPFPCEQSTFSSQKVEQRRNGTIAFPCERGLRLGKHGTCVWLTQKFSKRTVCKAFRSSAWNWKNTPSDYCHTSREKIFHMINHYLQNCNISCLREGCMTGISILDKLYELVMCFLSKTIFNS